MKDGYRCTSCGVFVDKGSDVYIVKGNDEIYFPTCSAKCAEYFKKENIEILKDKIERIKNQSIEKEIW